MNALAWLRPVSDIGTTSIRSAWSGAVVVSLMPFAFPKESRGSDAPTAMRVRRAVRWHWVNKREVVLPLLLLAIAVVVLQLLGGDRWIADRLFAAEGGQWALRRAFWITHVMHSGGKLLSTAAWCVFAGIGLMSFWRRDWRPLRRPVCVLLLSVGLSTLLVLLLKHTTGVDCPWDAAIYGGKHPYFTLFQTRPAGVKTSGCFPAGQASAGYAWVALYFFFLSVRPAWRRIGLCIGIGAGLALGIAQQLRGAHYLSHDIWTLAICWFVALALWHVAHRVALRRAALAAHHNLRALRARERCA